MNTHTQTLCLNLPKLVAQTPHVQAVLDFVASSGQTLTDREGAAFEMLRRGAGTDADANTVTRAAARILKLHPEFAVV